MSILASTRTSLTGSMELKGRRIAFTEKTSLEEREKLQLCQSLARKQNNDRDHCQTKLHH
jgi:hypothetical protein